MFKAYRRTVLACDVVVVVKIELLYVIGGSSVTIVASLFGLRTSTKLHSDIAIGRTVFLFFDADADDDDIVDVVASAVLAVVADIFC